MSEKVAEFEVSADPKPFQGGMQKISDSAQKAAKDVSEGFKAIEGSLQQVSNMFKSVTGMLGTLTAVIAGGKAFKDVIDATNSWNGEAKKLSTQMGITTERASVMMVAMRKMGVDSETLSMAAGKMSKQIQTNSEAFKTLGVAVRDSNGQYRPTLDIMGEVNAKLKEIKNPIEQNIAGTQVYGRSWHEVKGTLKITADEIKAAEQKAKDLGLVVGDEGVAQTKAYKESINDMKLVMTSLEVQLGNVVLPIFVKLGGWLSSVGPTAGKVMGVTMTSLSEIFKTVGEVVGELWDMVTSGFSEMGQLINTEMGVEAPGGLEIFANMLKVVEIAIVGFKTSFKVSIEWIKLYIEGFVTTALMMADVVCKALQADFSGAKQAWQNGTQQLEDIAKRHAKRMVEILAEGKAKVDDIVLRPPKIDPEIKDKKITGGPTYDFKNDGKSEKPKSRIHEWEAVLAADKDGYAKQQAIAGTAREYSHQQERDYWKKILDTVTLSKEERAQVEKKYYAVKAAIRKDEFDAEIAGEKSKLENYKHNHAERLAVVEGIYRANVARYGAESKEARAAMADIIKERRAMAEQELATNRVLAEAHRKASLAEIDDAERAAHFQRDQQSITETQLLQQLEQFEQQRFMLKKAALAEQLQLIKGTDEDPVTKAQLNAQLEEIERNHQQRMTDIKRRQYTEENRIRTDMQRSIEQGMQNIIAGTLNGSIKTTQILRSMLSVVYGAVVDTIAKMIVEWGKQALFGKLIESASALSKITANAGVAGSAAYASTAAIPIIGPELAPAAAAAAFSGAMSFAPAASAAGGYDIPAGVNPLVQTHAQEMILPAKYADVIRNLASNSSGGQSPAPAPVINYHDNTGRLSPAEIRRNAGIIANVLKDHARKT